MRRLLNRIGRRGAALLFFSMLDVVFCYGLLTLPRPLAPLYVWMSQIMPLWAWAGCWGFVAVVCLVFAFLAYDTPAFVAAISIKVGWGLLSLFGWIDGIIDRGYVSAAIWLVFAAFVFLLAGGIPAPPKGKVRVWIRSSPQR